MCVTYSLLFISSFCWNISSKFMSAFSNLNFLKIIIKWWNFGLITGAIGLSLLLCSLREFQLSTWIYQLKADDVGLTALNSIKIQMTWSAWQNKWSPCLRTDVLLLLLRYLYIQFVWQGFNGNTCDVPRQRQLRCSILINSTVSYCKVN